MAVVVVVVVVVVESISDSSSGGLVVVVMVMVVAAAAWKSRSRMEESSHPDKLADYIGGRGRRGLDLGRKRSGHCRAKVVL